MASLKEEFQFALLHGQLSLHYQPIIDLNSGHLRGFEALMRWNHPERGAIPPGEFIPVAEEGGLIVDASRWALKEACRALKRIEDRIGQVKNLYMSVNFSAKDFAEDAFLDDLYQIISASDVLPMQIQLEITEQLLKSQPETASKTLNLCRSAGLKIAIDDFGAGNDDIDFLNHFPFDTLKLDRQYVRQLLAAGETSLSQTLLKLKTAQHLHMTAEGVEEKEEALFLKNWGCDYAQGYYFAKPKPEKDLIELLLNMDGFGAKLAA